MVKKKLFFNFFQKRKVNSILMKIVKLKKKREVLGDKLSKGKINNKELKEYERLDGDIKKMTEKYGMEKGKIFTVPDKEKVKEVPQEQPVAPVQQPVQQVPQQPIAQEQPVMQEQQIPQQPQLTPEQHQQMELEKQAQLRAHRDAHLKAEYEKRKQAQLIAAQQQAALEEQRAAQQHVAQQKAIAAEQLRQQQMYDALTPEQKQMFHQKLAAQQQAEQAPQNAPVEDDVIEVSIFVPDMPILMRKIRRIDMLNFREQLDDIVYNNKMFQVGDTYVYGNKITGYNFSEIHRG